MNAHNPTTQLTRRSGIQLAFMVNLLLLAYVCTCAGLTGFAAVTDSGPETASVANRAMFALCIPAVANSIFVVLIAIRRNRDHLVGAMLGVVAGMFSFVAVFAFIDMLLGG